MKLKIIIIIVCALFIAYYPVTPAAYAGHDAFYYSKAVKAAKAGQDDFAFMYYQELLRGSGNKRYRENALFATGEYYFALFQYNKAARSFEQFVKNTPKSKGLLFALSYLLKIAEAKNDKAAIKAIAKRIVTHKQVGFLFIDKKEYRYLSPLYRYYYRASIQIDKVKVFKNGDLFTEISY